MRIVKPSYAIERLEDTDVIFQRIERAGRTCYKSEELITPESARKFIQMLIKRGHLSVIEHEDMTVRFICDRGFTHELVRHRLVSYSQESTRYCNYSKAGFDNQITVIDRCYWNEDDTKYVFWESACRNAERTYMELIEEGAKPEEARAVLPIGLKTEIVASANLREWGHIFYQRTSEKAHPQMRELMVPLLAEMRDRIPILYEDLSIYR
jgi:thymidylate synthase (FAD)